MSGNTLYVEFQYNSEKDSFLITKSNMKESNLPKIVTEFLETIQTEESVVVLAKNPDLYNIRLELDLSYNKFSCIDNCESPIVRKGIFLNFLKLFPEE